MYTIIKTIKLENIPTREHLAENQGVQCTCSEAAAWQQQTGTVQSGRLDRSPDLQPDKITQRLPVSSAMIPSQAVLSLPSHTAPSKPQIAPITA